MKMKKQIRKLNKRLQEKNMELFYKNKELLEINLIADGKQESINNMKKMMQDTNNIIISKNTIIKYLELKLCKDK